MTWVAAMRWALIRALDTGMRYKVVGYRSPGSGEWRYIARNTGRDVLAWRMARPRE